MRTKWWFLCETMVFFPITIKHTKNKYNFFVSWSMQSSTMNEYLTIKLFYWEKMYFFVTKIYHCFGMFLICKCPTSWRKSKNRRHCFFFIIVADNYVDPKTETKKKKKFLSSGVKLAYPVLKSNHNHLHFCKYKQKRYFLIVYLL